MAGFALRGVVTLLSSLIHATGNKGDNNRGIVGAQTTSLSETIRN